MDVHRLLDQQESIFNCIGSHARHHAMPVMSCI